MYCALCSPLVWLAVNTSRWLETQLEQLTGASTSGLSNMVVSGPSDFLDGDWLQALPREPGEAVWPLLTKPWRAYSLTSAILC